jgi:hypothetical protein
MEAGKCSRTAKRHREGAEAKEESKKNDFLPGLRALPVNQQKPASRACLPASNKRTDPTAMKHIPRFYFALALLALALPTVLRAQDEQPIRPDPPKNMSVDQVINTFAQKEGEFARARANYTYRQTVKVQTLEGDTVDGEFQQTTDINFDPNGKRIEQVVYAPPPTLSRVSMTKEDFEQIRSIMPFVVTPETLGDYNITYVGQQKVDELNTYVFDMAPKHIDRNRQYFDGRVWVDDRDLQIVMTRGRSVPEVRGHGQENLFPRFTTWREQVDGHYWFPTYTRADDTLHFSSGDVQIREIVKYTNYKRFGSNVKITYDGKEIQPGQAQTPSVPQSDRTSTPAPNDRPNGTTPPPQ